ncbi:helix-turn-helix domain-containing protein [Gordonibacter massiliensis (ex Traore et al. 2017)]|uniref:helix-turn-helix domain-containing protein n=1 Tax=Gordonibacter massiliensis (ex Traore et al. 2017) TaxID=1841863 RepID=UPI003F689810
MLKTGESLRTGEVADALDLGLSRTRELLSSMVSKGLVVPEGTGRARVYRLPDEVRE